MLRKIKWISGIMITAGLLLTACQNDSAGEGGDATDEQAEMSGQQQDNQMAGQKTTQLSSRNNMKSGTQASKKNEAKVPAGPKTTISFAEMSHDFGTISDGDKVRHKFEFTNSGDEPLIISNAKGSCGCTVPNWPKDPIPPGEKGMIEVEYNSRGKGKVGGRKDSKTVTVTANTEPATTRLKISANVVKEKG